MGGSLNFLSSCGVVRSAPFQSSVQPFTGWDRPGLHRGSLASNQGQITMRLVGTRQAGVLCVTLIKGLQPEPWASEQFQNSMFSLTAGKRCLPGIRGCGTARTLEDTVPSWPSEIVEGQWVLGGVTWAPPSPWVALLPPTLLWSGLCAPLWIGWVWNEPQHVFFFLIILLFLLLFPKSL